MPEEESHTLVVYFSTALGLCGLSLIVEVCFLNERLLSFFVVVFPELVGRKDNINACSESARHLSMV